MKFKIKTNLVTGIVLGIFSLVMLLIMPSQVRLPMFDSGAPSPRIIPGICLTGILICATILIAQSMILKKESVFEFDMEKERHCIVIILLLCAFAALTVNIGFIPAVVLIFPVLLWYCGERKPFIYIFTLAAGIAIFYLFKFVFHISLPTFGGFGG